MKEFTAKVKAIKARPVYLSPSPENNGDTMAKIGGGNKRLSDYSVALKQYAARGESAVRRSVSSRPGHLGQEQAERELLANSLVNSQGD